MTGHQSLYEVMSEQSSEQADKPVYTVDEMSGAVRWSIVVLCLLAFVCAASPAFWYSFY
jgi:hypothetical protein